MGLTEPFYPLWKNFSGRDLILLGEELFLIAKSTFEIHHKVEEVQNKEIKQLSGVASKFILFQILLLDIVFL